MTKNEELLNTYFMQVALRRDPDREEKLILDRLNALDILLKRLRIYQDVDPKYLHRIEMEPIQKNSSPEEFELLVNLVNTVTSEDHTHEVPRNK